MIDPYKHVQVVSALEAKIEALQQENERLREALSSKDTVSVPKELAEAFCNAYTEASPEAKLRRSTARVNLCSHFLKELQGANALGANAAPPLQEQRE